jgi:hypothetical protein
MSELISPVTLANELARRVMAMVTAEDRDRGVKYDPNELLQWAATWLSERMPLSESDTLESLAVELCEAFFADGGATTGDSPSAEAVDSIIEKVASLKRYDLLSDDDLAILAEAISVEGGGFDDPDEIAEWLKRDGDDTLQSLRDGYVMACQKEAARKGDR